MANKHRDIDESKLLDLAAEYIIDCENNRNEQLSNKGEIVEVGKRKIADWKYFVSWWLVKKGFDFYTRQYSYDVEKDLSHPLSDTIKKIKAMMDGYSSDVVANEGTGIFWAKHRLGMSDKALDDSENQNQIKINLKDIEIVVNKTLDDNKEV